jgi:arginase
MMCNKVSIIGAASGWGAQDFRTAHGPVFLKNNLSLIQDHKLKEFLSNNYIKILFPSNKSYNTAVNYDLKEILVANICKKLSSLIVRSSITNNFPVVIGGDHSIAIGTWHGIANAYNCYQNLGLIWIDAHMDAHIKQTSPSMAIHGMPLAILTGNTDSKPMLTMLKNKLAPILPEHVILIGVRSYEEEEKILLEKLNIKVYYMEEVIQYGFEQIFLQSIEYLKNNTKCIGLTLDLDAFDPLFIPGTASISSNGIIPLDFLNSLDKISINQSFICFEIVEYNPYLDINYKTFNFIIEVLSKLYYQSI